MYAQYWRQHEQVLVEAEFMCCKQCCSAIWPPFLRCCEQPLGVPQVVALWVWWRRRRGAPSGGGLQGWQHLCCCENSHQCFKRWLRGWQLWLKYDRWVSAGWLLLCKMSNSVMLILQFCIVHLCCSLIQFHFATFILQWCSISWPEYPKFSSFSYSIHED